MVTELNLLNPLKLQVPDDDIIGDEEEEEKEEKEEEKEGEEKEDFDAEPGTKKEEEDYLE